MKKNKFITLHHQESAKIEDIKVFHLAKENFNYKGFVGSVNHCQGGEYWYGHYEHEYYYGRILNAKRLVTYESEKLSELEKAFKESVDDYIEDGGVANEET